MDDNSNKLITILNNYEIEIDNNNLLLQNKIKKKIMYIRYLKSYGFSLFTKNSNEENDGNGNNNIILDKIDKYCNSPDCNMKLVYNPDLDKLLGDIIHNIYINSGFQLLLSNFPNEGETQNGKTVSIDTDVIIDTLEEFIGEDNIIQIFYLPHNKYLCKVRKNDDARYIQYRLNNMIINDKQIIIDYIEPQISNNTFTLNNENRKYNESNIVKGYIYPFIDFIKNFVNSFLIAVYKIIKV